MNQSISLDIESGLLPFQDNFEFPTKKQLQVAFLNNLSLQIPMSTRSSRYCLPRRSKHQLYMNIVPLLPNFALIIKNIQKIRQAKEKILRKEQSKQEEKTKKQQINNIVLSPQKNFEHQKAQKPINIQHEYTQELKTKPEVKPPKTRLQKVKKTRHTKNRRWYCPKGGKIEDQISFTFFNSIQQYFL